MKLREQARTLLEKADQDLFVLDKLLADPASPAEAIGFNAQQAAEKLLKAALVAAGVGYPKTHRLAQLLDLLADGGVVLPPGLDELRILTPFAVDFRYDMYVPDEEEPFDWPEIRRLLKDLRGWMRGRLLGNGA